MKTILRQIRTTKAGRTLGAPSPLQLVGGVLAMAVAAVGLTAVGAPSTLVFIAGLALGALVPMVLRAGRTRGDDTGAAVAVTEVPPDAAADEAREGDTARGLVDAFATPVLVVAENGLIAHANPAAHASLPRAAIGSHHASVIRAPEFVEAVARCFADGLARHVSFAASPGRERLLDARLSLLPVLRGFGAGRALVVQIEDRTEAARTEQLRSDFVANASHELRTPLSSIIGFIETLQHHAKDDAAARERFLGIMAREATRMQRLVDDLLSLSRIEMTQHVRPSTPCSVAEIAGEAASSLTAVAKAEGVRLEIELPAAVPLVPGDRDQLFQVFLNLVDNAIKYAGSGATVRIDAPPPSRAFPGRIGVRISDTGPGIPREHLPRLTERFYRANVGQSRHKGGTGLGLAIVKHILHRHEGKLEIVSTLGKGSAFTVWLPGSAEEKAESAAS